MIEPTQAQQGSLAALSHFRLLFQLSLGELVLAPQEKCGFAYVLDLDGRLYPYSWYEATNRRRPGPLQKQPSAPG
jgi:hypothetical protein